MTIKKAKSEAMSDADRVIAKNGDPGQGDRLMEKKRVSGSKK